MFATNPSGLEVMMRNLSNLSSYVFVAVEIKNNNQLNMRTNVFSDPAMNAY